MTFLHNRWIQQIHKIQYDLGIDMARYGEDRSIVLNAGRRSETMADETNTGNVQPKFVMPDALTGKWLDITTQGVDVVLTGWKNIEKDTGKKDPEGKPIVKPAVRFDVVSLNGNPSTKQFETSSTGLCKQLEPIIQTAQEANEGQIRVRIKKILGFNKQGLPDQTKNVYRVKNMNDPNTEGDEDE